MEVMTLDEAIQHAEEVMVENLGKTKDRNASDPIAISCGECADNHRQLAEWLKDYKRLLEQDSKTEVLDKIRAEITDTLYVDSLIFGELIDFRNGKISADEVIDEFNRVTRLEVLKIIDKYKAECEDS